MWLWHDLIVCHPSASRIETLLESADMILLQLMYVQLELLTGKLIESSRMVKVGVRQCHVKGSFFIDQATILQALG